MRFNDYHKQISAALKFDEDTARKYRAFMIRCYSRQLTPNACLALVQIEMERVASLPKPGDRPV